MAEAKNQETLIALAEAGSARDAFLEERHLGQRSVLGRVSSQVRELEAKIRELRKSA